MEIVEIFEAVSRPVLSVVVLKKGGKFASPRTIFVSKDPSPANFAVIRPAEIVEKNP